MRNRTQYPAEWYDTIRPNILKRDNHRCTKCGIKHRSWVAVSPSKKRVQIDKDEKADYEREFYKVYQILLHVCHIDHNKSNISEDNLITLCVRCHALNDGKYKGLIRKGNKVSNQLNIMDFALNYLPPSPPLKSL